MARHSVTFLAIVLRSCVLSLMPAAASAATTSESSSGNGWIIWVLLAGAGAWYQYRKGGFVGTFDPQPGELTAANTIDTDDRINSLFDKKDGVLWCTGKYDNKLKTEVSTRDGSRVRKVRVQIKYRIRRSVASMPHREREAARMLYLMMSQQHITAREFDRLRFALIWADGKGEIVNQKWQVNDISAVRQHNLGSAPDILAHKAKQMGIALESAVSQIFSSLDAAKLRQPNSKGIADIANRVSSGNVWQQAAELTGTTLTTASDVSNLLLGVAKDTNKAVFYGGEGSLVTVAPPGSGKTQCHVITNLLLWTGPAIVLDVTGDLWRTTSLERQKLGPVFRLNAVDASNSHKYNPIDCVRTDPDFVWEDAKLIADMLVLRESKTEPFFENRARDIITAVIAYLVTCVEPERRNFDTLLNVLSGLNWQSFINGSIEQQSVPSLERVAASLSEMEERTRSNVLQTALTSVDAWEGGQVRKVTRSSDWHPSVLRAKNATIYICLSSTTLKAYAGLARLIIGQHIKVLLESATDRNSPWVQFFLDELPQLRAMEPIRQALDVGRNKRLRLWMFTQYVAQLEDAYGKDVARGMIGACGLRAYMNPSLSDGTAEKLSEELGKTDSVVDQSRRNVAEPHELAGSDYKDDIIVFVAGHKPMRLKKVHSYESSFFRDKFGEADMSGGVRT
ncbi:type IV secretory system conjugative DNA transfer family protein [Mesorhizobium sp. B2-4-9]|uniref:type IV secretory system conjugative DNA transfer family protein n=1 Tax=Mesorhizobium sp. B2-4-9 TaxID=2589940 RepID=UPI00112DC4C0|nr:type IV secretory system conjugative DNA transfer family protein [Mesorhizobium sp. B2-4-9]TPL14820.1 type IV secretory system conjugative DNA transfer family protein [Mesorhizobium sp. B2-4-9]